MRLPANALALLVALAGAPARADGEFLQLDLSASTVGGVASVQRGPLTFGGVVTIPQDDPSALASASWGWAIPGGATLRAGPALGLSAPDLSEAELGARVVVERYVATGWGGLFGLAEASTVDRSGFVLAQLTLAEPRLTLEASRGASETYAETTVALSRRLGDSPVSLRAGYRFEAGEVFVGVSVNTF